MKPRILLVSANTETAPYPAAPIGLCLLATSLEPAFDVRVYDAAFPKASLEAAVADFGPQAVGVSIRNIDDMAMDRGRSYVGEIEVVTLEPLRRCFDGPLALGGAGYSLFPVALLRRFGAAAGLVGEAEVSGPALFDRLVRGLDPSGLPGIVTPADTVAPRPACAPPPLRLRESRIDEWIDFEPYRARSSYPVQTKRGCRHGCIYCSYPSIEGRFLRRRPSAEVVAEIAAARGRLGQVTFEFVDSTFDDPVEHARELCDALAAADMGLKLRTMGLAPHSVDRDLLQRMRRAGFTQVDCTPDSASLTLLETLRKGFGRSQLERAARALRDESMPTMWFFILGGPGETERTLDETFDFIDRFVHPEDLVHLTVGLRIYPGTPLHRESLSQGLVAPDDDLLVPKFYVDPRLPEEALRQLVASRLVHRPNCLLSSETKPEPALLSAALAERAATGTDEPMFRTLLRLRRSRGQH